MERFVTVSYQLFTLMVAVILTAEHVRAIDTVPQLNISQYEGRWYQVYGNPLVDYFIERNCKCVTADYGRNPNGTISVLNACRLKAPDGELNIVEGYAFRPDESEPGKLSVVFPSMNIFGRLFGGGANYWVVQLGLPTFEGDQYQYSVVTDRFKLTLFVLARNVTEFKEKYDKEVVAKLREEGFTRFYNRPTETFQGEECLYIDSESVQEQF